MRHLEFDFKKRHSPEVTIEARGRIEFGDASVVALFGPSGAGKSTFLRWIAGLSSLSKGDHGKLTFRDGHGETVWSDHSMRLNVVPQERKIGYVNQGASLFPHLTAEQNISYGLRMLSPEARSSRVDELLRIFELEELKSQLPPTLSGGQKQRVALARALAIRPKLLLLDEPFSSLDYPTRERLLPLVRQWLLSFSVPTLLVTHDPREAEALQAPLIAFTGHQLFI